MKHRNLIAIAVAAALSAPLAGFAQSDSTAVTVNPGRTDSSPMGEQRTNESTPQHPAGGDSGRMRSQRMAVNNTNPSADNPAPRVPEIAPYSPSPVGRSRELEIPEVSSGTSQTTADPSANPSAPPGRAGDVTPRSDSPVGRPAGQSSDLPSGDGAQPAAEDPPAARSGDVAPGNRTPGARTPSEPQPQSSKGSQTPPSR